MKVRLVQNDPLISLGNEINRNADNPLEFLGFAMRDSSVELANRLLYETTQNIWLDKTENQCH